MIETSHIHFETLRKLCCFCSDINTQLLLENTFEIEAEECSSVSSTVQWVCGWMEKNRWIEGWMGGNEGG